MKRMIITATVFVIVTAGCNNESSSPATTPAKGHEKKENVLNSGRHFTGSFSDGMKGNKISFDISADGKKLENLTFQGYWYCDGKLELTTAGPDGAFPVENHKVNSHISEPPDGGSTAWRFDLSAAMEGNKASGSFRMNINNLGCNTGTLHWTATAAE